jgi:hypothetical protein
MNTTGTVLRRAMWAVGILMAASAASAISAEPPSYPLVCRGGASPFQLYIDFGGSDKSFLTVSFRGASAGVNTRPPERGECAWLDRGWRSGEPQVLRWAGNLDDVRLVFSPDGRLSSVDLPRAGPGGAQLKYLIDALRSGSPYQVHAHSAALFGARFLIVTRVGP